jgi:hypothetical protein
LIARFQFSASTSLASSSVVVVELVGEVVEVAESLEVELVLLSSPWDSPLARR